MASTKKLAFLSVGVDDQRQGGANNCPRQWSSRRRRAIHFGACKGPCRRASVASASSTLQRWDIGTACPFLIEASCSIYEVRPMACRVLFNLDDDDLLCRQGPAELAEVPYADSRMLRALALAAQPAEILADIRDFFPPPMTTCTLRSDDRALPVSRIKHWSRRLKVCPWPCLKKQQRTWSAAFFRDAPRLASALRSAGAHDVLFSDFPNQVHSSS